MVRSKKAPKKNLKRSDKLKLRKIRGNYFLKSPPLHDVGVTRLVQNHAGVSRSVPKLKVGPILKIQK